MLTCLTALEARAIAYLVTPEEWSIYSHIEARIIDSIQNGGTSIIYAGEFNMHVVDALRALGYEVTIMQHNNKNQMIRISWSNVICSKEIKE